MKTKFLIVIAGPTAVGKTKLSLQLAKHYNSVILSTDSRQFYKEMTIGTAKPSIVDLKEVEHYFINTKSVSELYGAGHFEKDALNLLDTLYLKNDIVVAVGGSGLYINALINGVDEFTEIPLSLREKLTEEYQKHGINWLQQELEKVDKNYLEKADTHNPQRLMRALEVSMHTGKPYSSFLTLKKMKRNFTAIPIFINTERQLLYDNINKRVDEMIKEGLVEEVKQLLPFRQLNALKTVGYKEIFEYLDGEIDLSKAIDKIKQHTRNYAKRQITWFKNKGEFEEFLPQDLEKIIAYVDIICQHG